MDILRLLKLDICRLELDFVRHGECKITSSFTQALEDEKTERTSKTASMAGCEGAPFKKLRVGREMTLLMTSRMFCLTQRVQPHLFFTQRNLTCPLFCSFISVSDLYR